MVCRYIFRTSGPWSSMKVIGSESRSYECNRIHFCVFSSIRQCLSCDDYLKDKIEDYQNCSVLYCITQLCTHTDMNNSSYRRTVLGLGF